MANKTVIAGKEELVKKLASKMKEEKLILLVNYTGTTVEDDTKLRKDLRDANAESTVVKNNIIKRALDANGESGLDDVLTGPIAIVSSVGDYLAPLKVAYKFSSEHENYQLKGAIVEGKVMTADELITLAKLPSREELLSKLAGSLLGTISKLAVAVDQVRIKKETETATVATEATPVQA